MGVQKGIAKPKPTVEDYVKYFKIAISSTNTYCREVGLDKILSEIITEPFSSPKEIVG